MPEAATRDDPFSALHFLIEIEGVTLAAFKECSGLTSEIEVIEYRTGDDAGPARKLPGAIRFGDIILKRGITNSTELWKWHREALNGDVQRRNGSIVLLDGSGQPILRWTFVQGWPRRYEGPTFNATANDVAIETIEICHEGLDLAAP